MVSVKSDMKSFSGIAASPGIAMGRLRIVDRRRAVVSEYPISSETILHEIGRLVQAIEDTRQELENLRIRLAETTGEDNLFFIETHLMILSDERLSTETTEIIRTGLINAEGALRRTLHRYRETFESIDDPYLRERISDVETVIERILRNMNNETVEPMPQHEGQIIIAAHDISPADMLQINRSNVLAIITEIGGRTSHTAILARALELPAVMGVEGITDLLFDAASVVVDGLSGTVIINPDQDTFQSFLSRKQHYEYVEYELLKTAPLPAVTPDGHSIFLRGNVEIPEEGASVLAHGGSGVGLFRTEIIFMNRTYMPEEEEQFSLYTAMQQAIAPHLLTIRTMDAGGDKLLDGMDLIAEANPALGLRAIRISLGTPEEFKKQLRAILRVSANGPVRVMFPMISGIEEVRAAKKLLDEAKQELTYVRIPYDTEIKVGIMIEIPAAVTIADLLAREVDFFSVGTNDLIQYTLAIDRSNEQLSHLYQPLHPAVLRALRRIVQAAHGAGIQACLCGEMAGDPLYLPILLGLGFDELSMGAGSLLRVKQILRRCTLGRATRIAEGCFVFSTAAEVKSYLQSQITFDVAESID
ncbi:MAG: phosphoenolpyruvate--protein phosphotransferase [Desulfuromonadaceae bacterium]|nr:phosphoenolpyruvate--protein phosphotransferase [Desulfuromonadaceae bacterium]MDD2855457.1 phosphoenolpyruvate--protein phosphotransferase [Desulfuromonadaceae bacterium]